MAKCGEVVIALLAALSLHAAPSLAADSPALPDAPEATEAPKRHTSYEEAIPREHTTIESIQYAATIYAIVLAGYLYISRDEVFHNASLQNYAANFGNMTFFDQDLPSSNWGVHLLTGAVTYEFYRARSYT